MNNMFDRSLKLPMFREKFSKHFILICIKIFNVSVILTYKNIPKYKRPNSLILENFKKKN